MIEENQEIVTSVSNSGESTLLTCKPSPTNKDQKICADLETANKTAANETRRAKEGMLDNNTYNILEQLTNENKSLWRIKNSYKKDSATDNESLKLWEKIEKDKEELVQLLSQKLRERL